MKILITGSAGFIGHATAQELLRQDYEIIGIDNINDYYDINLKLDRLKTIEVNSNFSFYPYDISNKNDLFDVFKKHQPERVIHLAAQAGVRYSIENPDVYIQANLVGFANILEACRHFNVEHLVYASSSSVYGMNDKYPYSVNDHVDNPVSLYAATKKSNELMAHAYSHLYNLAVTGLRYFTVYGPWGRPDMAPFKFIDKIAKGQTIQVFNHGKHKRDFTFIDDIVNGTILVLNSTPKQNKRYRIYNIGYGSPVELMRFIEIIESTLGIRANKEFLPQQPGDVLMTWADTKTLVEEIGYTPKVALEEGIARLVDWYKTYFRV